MCVIDIMKSSLLHLKRNIVLACVNLMRGTCRVMFGRQAAQLVVYVVNDAGIVRAFHAYHALSDVSHDN